MTTSSAQKFKCSKGVYLLLLICLARGVLAQTEFVHPGLLHSQEDLDRIKAAVAAKQQPIYAGFEVLQRHPASQTNYHRRKAAEEIGRNPNVNFNEFDADANAAYQCALMWVITSNRAFAETSEDIVNAWSVKLKRVTGADAVLMAGLGPFKLVNAAEILRYTDGNWDDEDIELAEKLFREVIYPALRDFAPYANGNWDTAAIKTMMAIGVFCEEREMFERALRYYVDGAGDGRLTHYIINDAGQCQESGRDMPHTQLGLGHLGDACEIAWHQGLDLYGYADNRLLKGFEYTAKYNLGETVPFVETLDRTGYYHHTTISTSGRGNLRPVFEQIYNHYANRVGIAAPWTQKAAEKLRPEGRAPGADHMGFGTLLYSRSPMDAAAPPGTAAPASPAAIIAQASSNGIALKWVTVIGATNYIVTRSDSPDAPFKIMSKTNATSFVDAKAQPGRPYRYVVYARTPAGESQESAPVAICAGLPAPWKHADVGAVKVAGGTGFDGSTYTLEGAGSEMGGKTDEFQFAYAPFTGDDVITACFVPPASSQFGKFGIVVRESLAPDAPQAGLLIAPAPARQRGGSRWNVQIVTRASLGSTVSTNVVSVPLPAAYASYGRIVKPCSLRLERKGDVFTCSISSTGEDWTTLGKLTVPLKRELLAGLGVCSRLTTVTTTVQFDNVSVTPTAH